jgi:hypothetical protein
VYALEDINDPIESRRLSQEQKDAFLKAHRWLLDVICQENPELGRRGPICPFVPKAVNLKTIKVTFLQSKNRSETALSRDILRLCRDFQTLEPTEGDDLQYKVLLIILLGLAPDDASRVIDGIQKGLKDELVEQGIMIGEFHPNQNTPGIWNKSFRPNRSPVPMLAVRNMVRTDWPFLLDTPEWIHSWVRHQVHNVNPAELLKILRELVGKLEQLEAEQKKKSGLDSNEP